MTITEAAQLVLQASTLAKGGDVFLLDMGFIKIMQFAKKLFQSFKFHTIKDNNHLRRY